MSLVLDSEPAVPASWLTPRLARAAPVHRWFVFPHSYAPELVGWLLDCLDVGHGSVILDPFCGAGTTLVEAQRHGHSSVGFDLLPLAILASQAKTQQVTPEHIQRGRAAMLRAVRRAAPEKPPSPILDRAFEPAAWGPLSAAMDAVCRREASEALQLAVLSIARRFSRLVADGGWLRNVEAELRAEELPLALDEALGRLVDDLGLIAGASVRAEIGDARSLPVPDGSIDAVITSPPYPNRHDYTRVFAVELELAFRLGGDVKELRYRALRSHPEARRIERPSVHGLAELDEQIALVAARHSDPRIPRMLDGYFCDLAGVLEELHRVLVPGGHAALVVGNAQYCGVPIAVDTWLAEIGTRRGFGLDHIEVLRIRGNSAQQMAVHGRHESRESLVLLRRGD